MTYLVYDSVIVEQPLITVHPLHTIHLW